MKKPSAKLIDRGLVWTMITGTAVALVWIFNNFVSASDFNELASELYIEKYYTLEDALEDEDEQGDIDRIERDMKRLKLKICRIEPQWEECPR